MKIFTIDNKQYHSMIEASSYLKQKAKERAKKDRLWNAVILALSIGLLAFNLILLYLVGC